MAILIQRREGERVPFVATASLRELIRYYAARRARIEARQTAEDMPSLLKKTLALQAATLSMVIEDLAALVECRPGRFDG